MFYNVWKQYSPGEFCKICEGGNEKRKFKTKYQTFRDTYFDEQFSCKFYPCLHHNNVCKSCCEKEKYLNCPYCGEFIQRVEYKKPSPELHGGQYGYWTVLYSNFEWLHCRKRLSSWLWRISLDHALDQEPLFRL